MKKFLIACSIIFLAGCTSNISTDDTFKFNEEIKKIEVYSNETAIEITSADDIAIIEKSMQDAILAEGTYTDISPNYVMEFYYEKGQTTNINLFYELGDDTGTFEADIQRYVLNNFNPSEFERIFKQVP